MFSKASTLRSAGRTVSVRQQGVWSRSQTTRQTAEADSPEAGSEAFQKVGMGDQSKESLGMDAQVSSTTTSSGTASDKVPKTPRLGFKMWRDERPPLGKLSHKSLEAVTAAAAQKWSSKSTRTYQKGPYVWLPLGERRVIFHRIFLRDSCQCEICIDQHSGQKSFETAAIKPDISASKIKVDKSGAVTVTWEPDLPGHTSSTYSQAWLEAVASNMPPPPTDVTSTAHYSLRLWETSSEFAEQGLELFDYARYMNDAPTFNRAMKKLGSWGLIFLDNVPQEETAVERIAEAIGPLRNTFYGRTWDVKSKPQAENVAYTAHHLGLHMDLLYMKNPPGIQLLHCLKASSNGGESMFADSFAAARSLYDGSSTRPPNIYLFYALCKFPVTYGYDKNGNYYRDTKPTIELEKHQRRPLEDPNKAQHESMPSIANVNWSPPFQVPFVVNNGQDIHDDGDLGNHLKQYHLAARAFTELLNSESAQFSYKLKPGQCVIFNNRRIVHGRQKFATETEERWLKGAYLDTDDFASTLRRAEQQGEQ